jgi:hypothetical protein
MGIGGPADRDTGGVQHRSGDGGTGAHADPSGANGDSQFNADSDRVAPTDEGADGRLNGDGGTDTGAGANRADRGDWGGYEHPARATERGYAAGL